MIAPGLSSSVSTIIKMRLPSSSSARYPQADNLLSISLCCKELAETSIKSVWVSHSFIVVYPHNISSARRYYFTGNKKSPCFIRHFCNIGFSHTIISRLSEPRLLYNTKQTFVLAIYISSVSTNLQGAPQHPSFAVRSESIVCPAKPINFEVP